MDCPACHTTLQMTEREGTEVDYCPRCHGVWLDRGALDRIVERDAARTDAGPAPRIGETHDAAGTTADESTQTREVPL